MIPLMLVEFKCYNFDMEKNKIDKIKQWLGSGSINFYGPPFSGKDTQAQALAELLGGKVVSGGDILRHNHGNQEVQRIMAEGGIIPSELFLQIIPPFFNHHEYSGVPLLLSSVGRLPEEVAVIENACLSSGHEIKAVILLDLPEAGVWHHFEISKKLHDRGVRADDGREALKKRLEEYAKTQAVIDHFREKDLLLVIDDNKDREVVGQEIIDALYQLATAKN